MKVLLFTSKEEDYLQDSIIHGFKSLFGIDAVEFPKKEILYHQKEAIRGGGFTLYGNLIEESVSLSTENIEEKLKSNHFDLIVFTSIARQYHFFLQYFKYIKNKKVIILDGEDIDIPFPYMWMHFKKYFSRPFPDKHFKYFKREISDNTFFRMGFGLLPKRLARRFFKRRIYPISFSIPATKIVSALPDKKKLFPVHIVDEEIAKKIEGAQTSYAFESEEAYYQDLQDSKYGITTRRAGWDCLRHYEIAANGAVICFRNLDLKPAHCAPHDLVHGINCISYSNYDELKKIIANIDEVEYLRLQKASLDWVKKNTTIEKIKSILI